MSCAPASRDLLEVSNDAPPPGDSAASAPASAPSPAGTRGAIVDPQEVLAFALGVPRLAGRGGPAPAPGENLFDVESVVFHRGFSGPAFVVSCLRNRGGDLLASTRVVSSGAFREGRRWAALADGAKAAVRELVTSIEPSLLPTAELRVSLLRKELRKERESRLRLEETLRVERAAVDRDAKLWRGLAAIAAARKRKRD